jgi:integrase
MIPFPKREYQLPLIVSPEVVLRLLEAAPSFSHQVIFSTLYGTGLRVSETLHVRVPDLDSQRMMIRIVRSMPAIRMATSNHLHTVGLSARAASAAPAASLWSVMRRSDLTQCKLRAIRPHFRSSFIIGIPRHGLKG